MRNQFARQEIHVFEVALRSPNSSLHVWQYTRDAKIKDGAAGTGGGDAT